MKGFEIQVRGPFDVSDRNKFMNNVPVQGETRRTSVQVPASPTSPIFSTKAANSSLINPDSVDGRWDELFMICGGTGITPMLQVR